MGVAEILLIVVVAAKLFGAVALVGVSWLTIFGAYVGFYVALFLLLVLFLILKAAITGR